MRGASCRGRTIMRCGFIAFSALFIAPSFPLYQKRQGCMPWRVAPQVRLELTTLRLTAECSAIELLRIIRGLWRDSFACPVACLSASGTFTLGFGSRPGFALRFCLALAPPRLRRSPRPASASCPAAPFFLMFWEREKLSFLPLLLDPGNFLLSQAVPSSVPSAFGGLTSVFGMGTGGALQLSSPETFRREASLAPHYPHLQNCTAIELTRKHSLFQIFRLFPSRSLRPPLSRFLRFLRLLLDGLPSQIKPSTD